MGNCGFSASEFNYRALLPRSWILADTMLVHFVCTVYSIYPLTKSRFCSIMVLPRQTVCSGIHNSGSMGSTPILGIWIFHFFISLWSWEL